MAFGVLVGLPSLRLRADYFAIATIAAAEIVRIDRQNARGLTGGNQGLCDRTRRTATDAWNDLSDPINDFGSQLGWSDPEPLLPLLLVDLGRRSLLATVAPQLRCSEIAVGRVLRAVREDEDAARALGKNTLAYKLQSLAIAAALGALAGLLPRAQPDLPPPGRLRAAVHLLRLRGARSSAASPATGGSRSARSSSGSSSRARASSTCPISARRPDRRAALRDHRAAADPA